MSNRLHNHRQGLGLPVLWCITAAVLFGASTPISKILLSAIGPFTLAGLLYLGAAAGVLPSALRTRWPEFRRDRARIRLLAGAVLFGGCLGPVLMLLGLRAAPAASVSLWLNLETVATTLLAWTFFREHVEKRSWIAFALVLAGGLTLAGPGDAAGLRAGLLVSLACLCWGLDNNLTALVDGFTPAQATLVKGLVAGSVNLAIGLATERPVFEPRILGVALVVGALSYGVSVMLYMAGAQHLGAGRSQLLFSASPFVGVLVAWTALHEPIRATQIAAAGLIATGIALMLTARHEHRHRHEPVRHTHSHRHDDGHHDHVHRGLPAGTRHMHPHEHGAIEHAHPHLPDLHHRHPH